MTRIKRILVPTDLSENASSIFELAKKTAEKNQAKIDLIHIIPETSDLEIYFDATTDSHSFLDDYRLIKAQLTEKLRGNLEVFFPEEIRGEILIHYKEKPAEAISRYAQEGNYDLIMIASKGRGNSIFARGSVSEKLIRISNVPVISSHEKSHAEINTIMMTTDGSKVSFEALPLAFTLAQNHGAELHLFAVLKFDNVMVSTIGRDARIGEYALEQIKRDVMEGLKNYVNQSDEFSFSGEVGETSAVLESEAGHKVNLKVVFEEAGSVHHAIANYAEKNAQMVVITTHGRSGLAKLFIGSVAEKIVRQLEMPILTVKPNFAKS